MTDINTYRDSLLASIDARAEYERAKKASNDSIQSTLTNMRKVVAHDAIVSIMLASNYNVDSFNRAERSTNRRNVYTLEKELNVAQYLASARALNHYTLAILRTLVALEKSDNATITHHDACCACSESVTNKDKSREKIIKTTRYARHVAANTAATQSSSSLNALQAYDVIRESRDTANHVVYSLNRESETTTKLLAKIAQ